MSSLQANVPSDLIEGHYQEFDHLIQEYPDRWGDVMLRMRTRAGKGELRKKDACGRLPLHEACFRGAPFDLVEAMVLEYPEAVRVPEDSGELPIHRACDCLEGDDISPKVVRMILDAYPEGAKSTDYKWGVLPLHDAVVKNAPLEVMRMLLDAHPEGVATCTKDGLLPLHMLLHPVDEEEEVEEKREKAELLFQHILDNEEACLVPNPVFHDTPLHIAARFDLLSLQTCARIRRCPPGVMMTVARRHRDQLRERDEDCNYPLHLAAFNPHLNGTRVSSPASGGESLDHSDDQGVEAGDDGGNGAGGNGGSVERGEAGVDGSGEANDDAEVDKDLIGELVKLYPGAAAARNADGRFPLCLAIESGKGWHEGVEAIADAAKHVVVIRDEATGLYPFMLAAVGDNSCLSTVFGLLIRCPELQRFSLD